jgi:hypothetical protein
MYHSLVCRALGGAPPVCKPDALPPGQKPIAVVNTLERKIELLGVDNRKSEDWPVIEELLKQVDTGYFKEVLAHSGLFMNANYKIVFLKSKDCETPYFGVNTQERKIKLYNVNDNSADWPAIRDLLLGADMQYSSEWKR